LVEKAWQRVKAKDSSFGEISTAYLVTNAIKAKVKLGMGSSLLKKKKKSLKKIIKETKTAVKSVKSKDSKDAIIIALKAARKFAGNRKTVNVPRVISVSKVGGVPPLIPLSLAFRNRSFNWWRSGHSKGC
jgi:hypothetical protein